MIRSGQPLACSTAPVDHVGRELASTSRPAEERAEQVRSATVVQPECLIGEVVVRTERWDAGKSCSPPTRWTAVKPHAHRRHDRSVRRPAAKRR